MTFANPVDVVGIAFFSLIFTVVILGVAWLWAQPKGGN